MKVALVIEQFDLSKGGQERSTLEIARLLAERNVEVTILTATAKNLTRQDGVRILNLGLFNPSRAARFRQFAYLADRLVHREQYDLVHAMTPILGADVYQPRGGLIDETFARNLARRTGLARRIRQLAGPNLRQRLVRRVERRLARQTPCRFLAVSEYVRDQCRRHLGLCDDRVVTIFNGVDLGRLPAWPDRQRRSHNRALFGVRSDQRVGIFAATNFKLKGLDVVVESAAILKRRSPEILGRLKFLIIGPDKVRGYFERIKDLGLSEQFLFVGPTADMGLMYELADFLVHPTWYDPCSRVVLEALACGVPAVTTRFNGAGEILRQADCGFVLDDPGDAAALAEVYSKLLDDGVRVRLAENARGTRERISMDRHVRELMEFYQTVVCQKHGK